MAQRPDQTIYMQDFPGLVNNLDPRQLPPGVAQVQVNAGCVVQGRLDVRGGLKIITFDPE